MTSPGRRMPAFALVSGTLLSATGSAMVIVAAPLVVLRLTGSAAQVGLVAAMGGLGAFAGSALVGPYIDRWGARRVCFLAGLAAAMATGAVPVLAWMDALTVPSLAICTLAIAALAAPSLAGRQVLVSVAARDAQVSENRLGAAIWLVQRAGLMLGGSAAAVAVTMVDLPTLYLFDLTSFLVAALLVQLIPLHRSSNAVERGGYFTSFWQGLKHGWRLPIIRLLLIAGLFLSALDASLLSVLLPVQLHNSGAEEQTLGWLAGALGAGALTGAIAYWWIADRVRQHLAALAGLTTQGIGYVLLGLEMQESITIVVIFLIGVGIAPMGPVMLWVVRHHVNADLRGQLIATAFAVNLAAVPIGQATVGAALELTPPAAILIFFGMIFIALSFPLAARMRTASLASVAAEKAAGRVRPRQLR